MSENSFCVPIDSKLAFASMTFAVEVDDGDGTPIVIRVAKPMVVSLADELVKWLDENVAAYEAIINDDGFCISFDKPEDAVAYKLRWR